MEVTKNFKLTYSELAMKVGNFVGYLNRDLTELTPRGVTQTDIDDFEDLGNAFEVFPPDEYYRAEVSEEVENKTEARNSSYQKIQSISGYVEQKWGLTSAKYKKLGIKGLSSMGDPKFLTMGRNVVAVANSYLLDLSSIGLTQTEIDSLESELQLMEDYFHAVDEKIAFREEKSQERVTKANGLYEELKKYSTIGKLVWENIDEAKYNDYIIYKSVNSGLTKPQNLVAVIDTVDPLKVNLSWDTVPDATIYEVFVSITDYSSPSGVFDPLTTTSNLSTQVSGAPGKRNYFKIKARNDSKSSAYSDEVYVEIIIM